MAPLMALVYVLVALAVIVLNIGQIPAVFSEIFQSAFGLNEAFAGTAGGITVAIMNGVKRGRMQLYFPWFWRYIMLMIQHIPAAVMQRLKF